MKQYTISSVLQKTNRLYQVLLHEVYKFSSKTDKLYQKFVNRCNSLFIIFAQFQNYIPAFEVISKAVSIDIKMIFDKVCLKKNWKGRVLMFCNIGYMMYMIGDYTSSLKFLYDAESLLLISDDNLKDLSLAHAVLTSIVLFKARRYSLIEKYIEIASDEFNSIIRGDRISKIHKTGCYNLYCLVTLMLEVLKTMNDGLISSTNSLMVAKKLKKHKISAVGILELFNSNNTIENGIFLVNSSEFQKILFVSVFFPFISKNTPIVDVKELTRAQENFKENKFNKARLLQSMGLNHKILEHKDFYTLIMTDSL